MSAVHHNSSLSTPALSPEQAAVAAALAHGSSVTRAAASAGVHRTTVHHWLRTSPGFRSAVETARREYAAAVEDELTDLSAAALKAIRDILDNPDAQPGVRLKAALAVLQRPRFPKPGWQLPAETGSPEERRIVQELAAVEADYRALRMTQAIEDADPGSSAAGTPRNAPCPCGSGIKYKRCCGRNAPAQLRANNRPGACVDSSQPDNATHVPGTWTNDHLTT